MSKRDQEWVPSAAVKSWARKYAARKYHRRTGSRLVKLDSKDNENRNSDIEELSQATGLSVSDKSIVYSAPVSRAHSTGEIATVSSEPRIRHYSVGDDTSVSFPSSPNLKTEVNQSALIMAASVEDALARLAVSVEKDNHKLLPPLPYFNGQTEKIQSGSSQTPWITYNCDEWLSMIEDAVQDNERWTEAGKLRTLQDKMLGSAREYWRVRGAEVNTLELARAYLMKRFPNTDTYATLTNQITEFKRKIGESIPEKATRIQLLYEKLGKVAPETKAAQKRNMKELFFRDMPEVVRDQVAEADDFSTAVEKTIAYLERHKELKLRSRDIQLESTFNKSEAKVNNVNTSNKGSEGKNKNKNNTKRKETQSRSHQGIGEEANINNINYRGYNNQFRGNNRRSFRYRGNYRGSRGNFRGNYRGNYQYGRGQGNYYRGYQGYQRGFRGRGFRRGNYGYSRGNTRKAPDKPTCERCGRYGHSRNFCMVKIPNATDSSKLEGESSYVRSRGSNLACWTCGSETHFSRSCPQQKNL